MDILYKKLDLTFSNIDIEKIRGEKVWSISTLEEFRIKDVEYLADCLKNKIQFITKPDFANLTQIQSSKISPHSDSFPSSLNIYLDVNEEVTYFWKEVTDDPLYVREKKNEVGIYVNSRLELLGSFVAKCNECYILNTHEIHSVDPNPNSKTRKILRFCWNHIPFSELHNHIKIFDTN